MGSAAAEAALSSASFSFARFRSSSESSDSSLARLLETLQLLDGLGDLLLRRHPGDARGEQIEQAEIVVDLRRGRCRAPRTHSNWRLRVAVAGGGGTRLRGSAARARCPSRNASRLPGAAAPPPRCPPRGGSCRAARALRRGRALRHRGAELAHGRGRVGLARARMRPRRSSASGLSLSRGGFSSTGSKPSRMAVQGVEREIEAAVAVVIARDRHHRGAVVGVQLERFLRDALRRARVALERFHLGEGRGDRRRFRHLSALLGQEAIGVVQVALARERAGRTRRWRARSRGRW
jgi:hypothetical protein